MALQKPMSTQSGASTERTSCLTIAWATSSASCSSAAVTVTRPRAARPSHDEHGPPITTYQDLSVDVHQLALDAATERREVGVDWECLEVHVRGTRLRTVGEALESERAKQIADRHRIGQGQHQGRVGRVVEDIARPGWRRRLPGAHEFPRPA